LFVGRVFVSAKGKAGCDTFFWRQKKVSKEKALKEDQGRFSSSKAELSTKKTMPLPL
jgi:hypothetical protein